MQSINLNLEMYVQRTIADSLCGHGGINWYENSILKKKCKTQYTIGQPNYFG